MTVPPVSIERRCTRHLFIVNVEISHKMATSTRKHWLTVAVVEDWREKLLREAENALRALLHLVSERQYRIKQCDIELSV